MTSTLAVLAILKPTWQVDVWDVYFYQMFYVEVAEQVLERLCPMFIYPNFQLLNLTSGLTVGNKFFTPQAFVIYLSRFNRIFLFFKCLFLNILPYCAIIQKQSIHYS